MDDDFIDGTQNNSLKSCKILSQRFGLICLRGWIQNHYNLPLLMPKPSRHKSQKYWSTYMIMLGKYGHHYPLSRQILHHPSPPIPSSSCHVISLKHWTVIDDEIQMVENHSLLQVTHPTIIHNVAHNSTLKHHLQTPLPRKSIYMRKVIGRLELFPTVLRRTINKVVSIMYTILLPMLMFLLNHEMDHWLKTRISM